MSHMRSAEPLAVAEPRLVARELGRMPYDVVHARMRAFTDARGPDSVDELWWVEHLPVFTLGQAARAEHLLDPGDIPVVQSDRGGQVTYHGPGQIIAYVLLDLRRLRIGVKTLVQSLEQAVIDMLAPAGIRAERRSGAPGVYVRDAKLAALGLRIRNGCSYHGLALNVDPELEPFRRINPCGYPGLRVTSIRELGLDWSRQSCVTRLTAALAATLGYTGIEMSGSVLLAAQDDSSDLERVDS